MLRYAITDRTLFPGDEDARQAALIQQAARWSESGIDFVQLREKDLEPGPLATLARRMQAALWSGGPGTRLLINSRADVALAIGAAGVHLTAASGELIPRQVGELYAAAGLPAPIVSISCHTLADVERVSESEPNSAATLILFGPVFEKRIAASPGTSTPVLPGTGLELLHTACTAASPTPVLALGGVTPENTPACLAAGAAGIAAIRLFR